MPFGPLCSHRRGRPRRRSGLAAFAANRSPKLRSGVVTGGHDGCDGSITSADIVGGGCGGDDEFAWLAHTVPPTVPPNPPQDLTPTVTPIAAPAASGPAPAQPRCPRTSA